MDKIKQVIVVRGDLTKMLKLKGKLCAQVSHASLGAVFKTSYVDDKHNKVIYMDSDMEHWFNCEFTKVVVKCENEQQLLDLCDQAIAAGIQNYALIKDAGHTVFSEPTYTCLGIGPVKSSVIDTITGHLPLL